jgi:hypothetical protein
MAQVASRSGFEDRAHEDPYAHMSSEDMEFIAQEMEIIPIDANSDDNDLSLDMSWAHRHIGGGGPLTVQDYGRHREECDTLADFVEFIREELADGFPSQYLKVMDDDKEQVADTLVAITKSDGYVVLPYFE